MKNSNIILLIVIAIIGIGTLVKLFTFDAHLKEAQRALKETKLELEMASQTNSKAQNEVLQLQEDIKSFQIKNERLSLTIDSITLAKRAKAPKDWEERQEIKRKQEEIKDRLTVLRDKDKEFE